MRTNYASVERKCNRNLAMCYIIYMICGSYFHKCTCTSRTEERRDFLHYRELKASEQERMESRIISTMESQGRDFLERLSELNCKAVIRKTEAGYQVDFWTGGFETISVTLKGNGNVWIDRG
ncbi:MAG: hypothetical protein LUH07_04635 [Lachnospiraceae bacterium]|nr:hypothetical protein [Lachnospiraceae bacterium]